MRSHHTKTHPLPKVTPRSVYTIRERADGFGCETTTTGAVACLSEIDFSRRVTSVRSFLSHLVVWGSPSPELARLEPEARRTSNLVAAEAPCISIYGAWTSQI